MQQTESAPKKSLKREILEWVVCLIVALAAFVVIRTFLFTMILVQGPSMMETLQDKDRVAATIIDLKINGPQRLDVVICNYPHVTDGSYRVKRVIGLPGETVQVKAGVTYVNGEALDEPYVRHPTSRDFGPYTVPDGHYFVMGDNRAVSKDSTYEDVGALSKDAIVAKARQIVWPLDRFQTIQ